MKALSLLAVVLTLGLSLGISDAEAAKRLGGGKSFGVQRQMTAPAKAPTVAPTQSPTAAASTATAAPAAAAAQTPKRSWMGPIAGLAAGLGLAALASHLGFGGELASILMLGLLAMAVVAVIGFFMRKRTAGPAPAMAGAGGAFQYRGSESGYPAPRNDVLSMPGSTVDTDAAPARNIPADFDVAGFVRNAKVNFIRLQAANDAGNLDDIREFTTPEMFAEIRMDFEERRGAAQETDVVTIDADVLEVAEEPTRYVVSVRFTGLVREEKDAAAEPIDEIWHLVKPRAGKGGWLLAGIQQTQ
ncbi:MAG: Tim44-like domain-containing protein [Propionivibrio sp.]